MSITSLITGKLIADPDRRTGASGKAYTLAKIAAHDGEADSLVSVIAFGTVGEQLAAMGKGDTVALTGRTKINTWTGNDGSTKFGLSVTADGMLTAYHLKRKRAAVAPPEAGTGMPPPQAHGGGEDFGGGDDGWLG